MATWMTSMLPPILVFATVVVLLAVVQRLLGRRPAGVAGRALHRQGLSALVVFIGILSLVVSMPIADSTRRQLLSLIGLLVSAAIALSSTTFVGNMMAGILQRIIRAFRPGDFIRVEGHFGRVSELGLLHTEIQTEDRDLITLPNLFLATHPVRVVRASGTVVSADVSLGYDVSHGTVSTALLSAAEAAGLTEPFVRIIELGDFSVTYRAAGILVEVKQLLTARSRLRAAILDHLHRADIEIVSPTFMNQRLLPEGRVFVPPSDEPEPDATNGDEIFPEDRVFDKAEKAESMQKLEEILATLDAKLADLDGQLEGCTDDGERARLERRAEHVKVLRERLSRRINDAGA